MTDPRPLRLRQGTPATDIMACDGQLLATIYPREPADTHTPRTADEMLRRYAEAEAIAAEIVRAYNASGWRPIESAPKDGTPIDLWVVAHLPPNPDMGYRVPAARWGELGWVREIEDGDYCGKESAIEWSVDKDVSPELRHSWWAKEGNRNWTATHWMPIPEGPA